VCQAAARAFPVRQAVLIGRWPVASAAAAEAGMNDLPVPPPS
jgi:hypothetical protein